MPTSYINLQIKGDIIHISQQNVVFIWLLSSCQFQTYNFCPSLVPMTQYLLITNLKKKLELKQKSQLSKDMLSPSNEIHFIPHKTGSCLNQGEGYSITFGLIGGWWVMHCIGMLWIIEYVHVISVTITKLAKPFFKALSQLK